jgi:hypothetical protein
MCTRFVTKSGEIRRSASRFEVAAESEEHVGVAEWPAGALKPRGANRNSSSHGGTRSKLELPIYRGGPALPRQHMVQEKRFHGFDSPRYDEIPCNMKLDSAAHWRRSSRHDRCGRLRPKHKHG